MENFISLLRDLEFDNDPLTIDQSLVEIGKKINNLLLKIEICKTIEEAKIILHYLI